MRPIDYPLGFIIEEALAAHRAGRPGQFRALLRLGIDQSERTERALRREQTGGACDYVTSTLPGAQEGLQGPVGA